MDASRIDLTSKIAVAIIAQLNHCDRHYSGPPHLRSKNLFKGNSRLFSAALLGALVGFFVQTYAVEAAAPQHHDQVPGFYRVKVGDLEVTALLDGGAKFDRPWLTPKKAPIAHVHRPLNQT